ncbi:ribosome-associated translation inhibitor RaiA [Mycoplasmatota bacterium]|nr:ribosome-associated translation inhibitor RaiA [Mycoplasmatota bacterium]
MLVEVVGKNGLEITQAINNFATEKMSKLEKFFNYRDELRVRVLCKVYNDHHKVEVTIPSKHFTLRTEVSDKDIYSAIDLSVDKLERQIKKFKTKVNKILKDREGISEFFAKEQDRDKKIDPQTEIVRIKSYDLTPMNVTEAIDQMEMVDHDFFIFLDETTLKVNVLYIREDGNYALIETN